MSDISGDLDNLGAKVKGDLSDKNGRKKQVIMVVATIGVLILTYLSYQALIGGGSGSADSSSADPATDSGVGSDATGDAPQGQLADDDASYITRQLDEISHNAARLKAQAKRVAHRKALLKTDHTKIHAREARIKKLGEKVKAAKGTHKRDESPGHHKAHPKAHKPIPHPAHPARNAHAIHERKGLAAGSAVTRHGQNQPG